MRRRGFLAGLILATTANVVTAQRRSPAQIGILDPGIPQLFDAFRDGMRSLGYVEGQNINTVLRSAQGRPEDVQPLAGRYRPGSRSRRSDLEHSHRVCRTWRCASLGDSD